ncbi:MAG: hypothetical protein H0U31_07150 [Chloroflexia bacterium]|nr:hypothetical protein [Chloroflexia bacterium]
MTTDPTANHFVAAILEILEETFDTHHGLFLDGGDSMFETLAAVTAGEAPRPVSASCASIAAQVNHPAYYLDVLREELDTAKELESIDWKQAWTIGPVNDEEWTALVAAFRTAADRTMAVLRGVANWDEDAAFGAVAIAVHTAYHLGEIRQALCTIQNREQLREAESDSSAS